MERKLKRINITFIVLEVTAVIGLIIFIVCVSGKNVREDVTFSELSEAVYAVVDGENGFSLSDAMGFRKYYGLDANEYEDILLYLPSSNMDAAELLIVIMRDESQSEELNAAMNKRLEQQKKVFESYGVEQMGILNQAVICIEGRYGLFAVCEDADNVKAAFKQVIEEVSGF